MSALHRSPLLILDLFLFATFGPLVALVVTTVAASVLSPCLLLRVPPERALGGERTALLDGGRTALLDASRTAQLFGQGTPSGAAEPVRSPLRASVVGTLVANLPRFSLATLRDELTGGVEVLQPGERFLGARLEAVEPLRVTLLRDGRREYLEAGGAKEGPTPGPVAGAGTVETFRIPRAALGRLAELGPGCRIVPFFLHGRAEGWKLFGIRAGSLPEQAGLRNGDAILRVDGQPLDTPERAFALQARLPDSSRFEVELLRKGVPITVVIELD